MTQRQKISFRAGQLLAVACAVAPWSAEAADFLKADNFDDLNLGTSWTSGTPPGAGDIAVWNSTVTGFSTSALGVDLSWAGIRVADPGGEVGIDAGNLLTLGAAGIDLSAATQNLTVNAPLVLGAAQTWNVADGITLNSTADKSGAALTKAGAGTLQLSGKNTSSAGITLSQGVLESGALAGFGTGTITLGDANTGAANLTLLYTAGNTSATNIVVSANGTGENVIKWNQDVWGSDGKTAGSANDMTLTLNRPVTFQTGNSGRQIGWKITGTGVAPGNVAIKANGGVQVTWTAAMNAANAAVQQSDFTGNVLVTGNTKLQVQNRAYQGNDVNHYNGVIPDAATVIVDAGSTLQFHHGAETIGFLSGGGTVNVGTGTDGNQLTIAGSATTPSTSPTTLGIATFSGTYSANQNPLIKNGTGTQEFVGTGITFGNGMLLNEGTVRLTRTTGFNSNVVFASGGTPTLQLNSAAAEDAWTFPRQITGGSATAKVEKIGLGSVSLNPASGSSFTGGLAVTEGSLYLNAAFDTPPVAAVGAASRLGGKASVGATTVAAGGTIEGGQSDSGALTLANLTFAGAGRLTGKPSATAAPIVVTNALVTGGAGTLSVSPSGGVPANGTYHMVQFGSLTGSIGDFKFASPVRAMSLQRNGNFIDVVVNSSNYPIWTGAGNGQWSTGTGTGNWKLSSDSSGTDFLALDNVLFNDAATGSTNIDVSAADISAGAITFNNSTKDYTLGGSKDITTGSLIKTGTGKLTITRSFSFSGGATLSGGTVSIASETGLGTGSRTFDGGTLEYTGPSASWSRDTTVNATGGTLNVTDAAATITHVGAFSGTGTFTKAGAGGLILNTPNGALDMSFNITGGTLQLNYGGNATVANGNFTGSAGILHLEGTGPNNSSGFTLTGNNTFSGTTEIYGRRVFLDSATGNAIGGDISIMKGNWAYHGLSLLRSEQIADTAVLRFLQTDDAYDFRLNGNSETLAGIETLPAGQGQTTDHAIIENGGYDGGNDADGLAIANLTVSGAGEYDFGGQLRDQNNPSGNNKLSFTKAGTGTQKLRGSAIRYTGDTLVQDGTLILEDVNQFGSPSLTVKEGAILNPTGATSLGGTVLTIETGGLLDPDLTEENLGEYTVPPAQTLAGGGTVDGGLYLLGAVAPGDGVGSMKIGGIVTLDNGSTFDWQVGGSWTAPQTDTLLADEYDILAFEPASMSVKISAEGLTGFTEANQTFTLLKSATGGFGFEPELFTIDASAFQAATGAMGTWAIQKSGNDLQLVYTAGTSSPYNAWASSFGLTGENRGVEADPDGDGIPNGIEFVTNGDPTRSSQANAPQLTGQGDNLIFTYTRRDDAEYLNPIVEFDTDLSGAWTPATTGVNSTITVAENGTAPDIVTVTIPRAGNPKLFVRLSVGAP